MDIHFIPLSKKSGFHWILYAYPGLCHFHEIHYFVIIFPTHYDHVYLKNGIISLSFGNSEPWHKDTGFRLLWLIREPSRARSFCTSRCIDLVAAYPGWHSPENASVRLIISLEILPLWAQLLSEPWHACSTSVHLWSAQCLRSRRCLKSDLKYRDCFLDFIDGFKFDLQ